VIQQLSAKRSICWWATWDWLKHWELQRERDWSVFSAGELLLIVTEKYIGIMHDLSRLKKPKNLWIRYLLVGILFSGVLYAVPVKKIWAVLRTCYIIPLILSIVILLVSRLLASLRTKSLTDSQELSLSIFRIFEISCTSTLYGMALPGSFSGGVIRWYRLSQQNSNRAGAFAVLAAERVVDFFVLAIVGILCWIGDITETVQPILFWGLTIVAIVCLLMIFFTFSFRRVLMEQPWLAPDRFLFWLPDFIVDGIKRILSAFEQYHKLGRGKIFLLFAISFAFHAIVTVAFYMMAISLDLGVSLITVGWIRACTVLLTALPITPSGLGIREVSSVILLVPLGVPAAHAVAFSLLQFLGLLSIATIGAIFEALRYLFVSTEAKKIISE
jgi:uncharacterized protein (TIRG00374 family)